MNLNILCNFLYIGLTKFFLVVHLALAGTAECYATVCLQNKVKTMFTLSQNVIMSFVTTSFVKNLFIDVANVICTGQKRLRSGYT